MRQMTITRAVITQNIVLLLVSVNSGLGFSNLTGVVFWVDKPVLVATMVWWYIGDSFGFGTVFDKLGMHLTKLCAVFIMRSSFITVVLRR